MVAKGARFELSIATIPHDFIRTAHRNLGQAIVIQVLHQHGLHAFPIARLRVIDRQPFAKRNTSFTRGELKS